MDTSVKRPFRFLALPLELQWLVFEKYFEEPWTVTEYPGLCFSFTREAYATNHGRLLDYFNLRELMLVSRHVRNEVKKVMSMQGSGTYTLYPLTASPIPCASPACFDCAIKTFNTSKCPTQDKILSLRKRFTNLKRIQGFETSYGSMRRTRKLAHSKVFADFIERKHDTELAAQAGKELRQYIWKNYQDLSDDLSIAWRTIFFVSEWRSPDEAARSHACCVVEVWLVMDSRQCTVETLRIRCLGDET